MVTIGIINYYLLLMNLGLESCMYDFNIFLFFNKRLPYKIVELEVTEKSLCLYTDLSKVAVLYKIFH